MDTQNYKRTVAGSVGAGLGAVFNASGRTYYILEHKTASKYHQMGESQKIIVDEIELGRHASCQVRFDESLDTVSRRHAAIVRDGSNWKLINLSTSNPTLVNGQPIHGAYYLQSGDEIQLAVNGPRMGFIVPQGRQALTSSIGLTERMGLFREQALRPYKRAITAMCIVFAIAMAGMGYWIFLQNIELKEQKKEYAALVEKSKDVDNQIVNLEGQLRNAKDQASRERINADLNAAKAAKIAADKAVQEYIINHKDVVEYDDSENYEEPVKSVETANVSNVTDSEYNVEMSDDGAANSLSAYYDDIYFLKIDKIEVEYGSTKFDPGIATSDIICGTGFVLSNGSFVTDRQNVQPWIYASDNAKTNWRYLLTEYVAIGCKVIIHYSAYSNKGTGKVLHFTNEEFGMNELADVTYSTIKISKEIRAVLTRYGVAIEKRVYREARRSIVAPTSRSYAVIRNKVSEGGITFDAYASGTLPGGSEIQMVGYVGSQDIHDLTLQHFNDKTTADGTNKSGGTIALQHKQGNDGYYGAPAFIQRDGKYYLVGMMVGNLNGYDRLVPARNFE